MKREIRNRPGAVKLLAVLGLVFSCSVQATPMTMTVTASAYNSLPKQTNEHPSRTAWGDELRPGMKAIAVSRDLLQAGLSYGSWVRIEGLPGRYRVLDKMHSRWSRKIDIYMGKNRQAALEWGVRPVRISWEARAD